MSQTARHKIVGYVHPVGTGQCFVTPVLLSEDAFWIQNISPEDQVTGFTQISLSGYVFPCRQEIFLKENSPAHFAFYVGGGTVLAGEKEALNDKLVSWVRRSRLSASVVESIIRFTGQREQLSDVSLEMSATGAGSVPSDNQTLNFDQSLPDALAIQSVFLDTSIRNAMQLLQIGATSASYFYSSVEMFLNGQRQLFSSFSGDSSIDRGSPKNAQDAKAAVKSAIAAANRAFEAMSKAAQAAAEIAEANVQKTSKAGSFSDAPILRKKAIGE